MHCTVRRCRGDWFHIWNPGLVSRAEKKESGGAQGLGQTGEATIIRLPKHKLGPPPGRSSVFTRVSIGLEIRVIGIETYEVDKVFTFPTHALNKLEEGKVVAMWVDPKEPRNLDKIVIHLD
jgi:hypothetical protein